MRGCALRDHWRTTASARARILFGSGTRTVEFACVARCVDEPSRGWSRAWNRRAWWFVATKTRENERCATRGAGRSEKRRYASHDRARVLCALGRGPTRFGRFFSDDLMFGSLGTRRFGNNDDEMSDRDIF